MKAWVRNSSVRARSCQETGAGCACMRAFSEGRWGAGADDLTRLAPDIAEAMGQLTRKIIGLAGPEHACGSSDGELDAAADHDAALLAPMRQHLLAGRGAGGIALVQQRQLPAAALCGHEP